jgi:serine/threonine protein phosphatase PrpC/LysM repeat protein
MSITTDTAAFQFGNHTDVGQVRAANEDYLGYFNTANGHIFVVCDGMGGHAGGAQAAQLAVESIRKFFEYKFYENLPEALRQSILYANQQILVYAQQNPEYRGMGTTCVLLVIRATEVWYAHVGDSRIYRLADGQLRRLTKDHSVVQGMIDQGTLSEEEAEHHPVKNVLTQALGTSADIQVDVAAQAVYPATGHLFLLCTDGLTGMVPERTIADVLNEHLPVQHKALKLVNLANEAGGQDNITVQVIHFAPPITTAATTEDMATRTRSSSPRKSGPAKKAPAKKTGPDLALILLCILAAVVLFLLIVGVDYMRDDVVQADELIYGHVSAVTPVSNASRSAADQDTGEPADPDEPASAPPAAPAASAKVPAKTDKPVKNEKPASTAAVPAGKSKASADTMIVHTVQSGETFSAIARRFNLNNNTLQSLNPGVKPEELKADITRLNVRVRAVHRVGAGDILSVVSQKYGVDKALIMTANAKTADRADRGEMLIIPLAQKQ